MNFTLIAAILLLALPVFECFRNSHSAVHVKFMRNMRSVTILRSSSDLDIQNAAIKQSQIAALNLMAAKLRAEAAELELDEQRELNLKLEGAFRLLSTDTDSLFTFEELRNGIALRLQSAISEEHLSKMMKRFDSDCDRSIENGEFRNILIKILAEKEDAVVEATQRAVAAKKAVEVAAAKSSAMQEQVVTTSPTGPDKIVSLLPYLLPLADVFPYSEEFITENNLEFNNLIFEFASEVFLLFQSIPFSGLFAFFLLNILTNNLNLNRLIRFNMQQAIFLDISLIIPGLLGSMGAFVSNQGELEMSKIIGDVGSTFTFLIISAGIIYSLGSSLLGIVPDKVPIISEIVKSRVPTSADILKNLESRENE